MKLSIEKLGLEKAILKKQILELTETITANDEKNQAVDIAITLVQFRISDEEKKLKTSEISAI